MSAIGAWLRWLLPTLVPVVVGLAPALRRLRARETKPAGVFALVFALGALLRWGTWLLERAAAEWFGLAPDTDEWFGVEPASTFVVLAVAAPIQQAGKIAAAWLPRLGQQARGRRVSVAYAITAASGFAALETFIALRWYPHGAAGSWLVRAWVALPAHWFFAAVWGYVLGQEGEHGSSAMRAGGVWVATSVGHGLYAYLVFGRGPGAIVATLPLLAAMAVVALWMARELRGPLDDYAKDEARDDSSRYGSSVGDGVSSSDGGERQSDDGAYRAAVGALPARARTSILAAADRVSRLYGGSVPPGFMAMREAMRREGHSLSIGWVVLGVLVTAGAVTLGLCVAIALGHWANVDFAAVDEVDVTTTGPVILLASGVLAAFPLSGFVLARASRLPTMLETSLASALAIAAVIVVLGLAAPVAVVFVLAFSPIAWALSCAGAWAGMTRR